jgi:hypothetical protein
LLAEIGTSAAKLLATVAILAKVTHLQGKSTLSNVEKPSTRHVNWPC